MKKIGCTIIKSGNNFYRSFIELVLLRDKYNNNDYDDESSKGEKDYYEN